MAALVLYATLAAPGRIPWEPSLDSYCGEDTRPSLSIRKTALRDVRLLFRIARAGTFHGLWGRLAAHMQVRIVGVRLVSDAELQVEGPSRGGDVPAAITKLYETDRCHIEFARRTASSPSVLNEGRDIDSS